MRTNPCANTAVMAQITMALKAIGEDFPALDEFTLVRLTGRILKAYDAVLVEEPKAWHVVNVGPADRERMPPGATCYICEVFDGIMRAVVWQTPEGYCLSLGHTSSDVSTVPDRLPSIPEVMYAVRNLWPAGSFAGLMIAGGDNSAPIPDGLFLTQVYQAPAAAAPATPPDERRSAGGIILMGDTH